MKCKMNGIGIQIKQFLRFFSSQFLQEKMSETLNGSSFPFSLLKNKICLIVNVASKCGKTPQYAGLEQLYQKYKKDVVVIGFPCNQFGKQEPGSSTEIQEFCTKNYGVTFPIVEKGDVNGSETHALYTYLKSSIPGDVAWNFEKFLVDRNGNVIERFKSAVTPDQIHASIDKLLL